MTLSLFAGALVVAFGAAYAVGAAGDPIANETTHAPAAKKDNATKHTADDTTAHGDSGTADLAGLVVSEASYTLAPRTTLLPRGDAVPFEFTITGEGGNPVTSYTPTHERDLHLIVVRRDLEGFQHVHPARTDDGTWLVPLDLPLAGVYRVFADFQPSALGRGLTLGADLFVPGKFEPIPLAPAAASARVGDYEVTLNGAPVVGQPAELAFTVTKERRGVSELQPYLGAFGHLVSLRAGDLAYLHTHPAERAHAGEKGGPEVRFTAEFPTAATYRLFLDFKVGGVVRTAEFTVVASPTGERDAPDTPSPHETSGDHGH